MAICRIQSHHGLKVKPVAQDVAKQTTGQAVQLRKSLHSIHTVMIRSSPHPSIQVSRTDQKRKKSSQILEEVNDFCVPTLSYRAPSRKRWACTGYILNALAVLYPTKMSLLIYKPYSLLTSAIVEVVLHLLQHTSKIKF